MTAHLELEIQKTSEEMEELLDRMKVGMFTKKGAAFLSSIMCNIDVKFDGDVKTISTNGLEIKMNPDWIAELDKEHRVTALAHSLYQSALMHPARCANRDLKKWTKASNIAVGNLLTSNGFQAPPGWYQDAQYHEKSAEETYNLLEDEPDSDDNQNGNGGGGSKNDPFNQSIQQNNDAGAEAQMTANAVKAVQASQMNKEAGVVPGDLELMLDKLLNPKLPWEVLVQQFLNEMCHDEYSWSRPRRRFLPHDIYLPHNQGVAGLDHIIYAFDTSGSMSDGQLQVANSEIKCVKDMYNPKLMEIIDFDTEIRSVQNFTEDDEFGALKFTGRGGTYLQPVFDYAIEKKPSALIVFSDMYCDMPKDPGFPVIFVVFDNKNFTAPYGKVVHIETE